MNAVADRFDVRRAILLSDTHGVIDARIAAAIRADDLVVHAGDVGDAGVLDALAARTRHVVAVRGNNDTPGKWKGDDDVLSSLPLERRIVLPGGLLVVVHGDAFASRVRHARLRAAHPDARAVFYGHSHRASIDREAEPWVLNAGAAGRQRTHGGPSYIELGVARGDWSVDLRRFPTA